MRKYFVSLALLLSAALAFAGNNSGWTNSGGSLSTQAKSITANAVSGSSPFFIEDFKTGYTWGTLPMSNQSTFNTQAGANWQYNSDMLASGTNQAGVDVWPADSSKNAFFIQYVTSEDINVIAHKFDPSHALDTARPTEMYVQWKEYRSSTFDFGPTKDWRANLFTSGHWGDSHDQPVSQGGVEVYGGFGTDVNAQTSGNDNATKAAINIQGAFFDQSAVTGDGNTIFQQAYAFPRATVVKIEIHIKVNTPGNADGAAEMWLDGVRQSNSRTNVRFTPATAWDSAGLGQAYIDGFQLGMAATNGTANPFNGVSKRFITDFKISTSYIP